MTMDEALRDKLVFTSDWVSHHAPVWQELLADVVGKPGALGLEIGVFEGRSALWWLENILTGEGARLKAIEPWRQKFEANLAVLREMGFGEDRLEVFWGHAQEVIRRFHSIRPQLDFAYIDGGKDADAVLQNSVLVWLLLKPGGVLIWDDYRWEWQEGSISPQVAHPPRIGIDAFLSAHDGKFEELHRDWQIAVRKTKP